MQPLNNDMDDLMRRAAEHYPLHPTGMDWQKVAQQLDENTAGPIVTKNEKSYKALLLLAFFLLVGLACDKYLIKHFGSPSMTTYIEPVKDFKVQPVDISSGNKKEKKEVTNGYETNGIKEFQFQNIHLVTKETANENAAINGEVDEDKAMIINSDAEAPLEYSVVTHAQSDSTVITQKNLAEEVSTIDTGNTAIQELPVTRLIRNKKDKHLYAGVMAGPDVTTVKMQRVEEAGYTVGVLAGYAFGKKWAAETGIYWSRKNYYSKGAYFKTDKIQLPNHATIINAEGYCGMFEIPVNLRYHLFKKEKQSLFVLAGVSSYLMQHEEYDYLYERYGNPYKSSKYYKQASRHWLSVMNLSAGYERALNRIGTIRVEPYLKLPLKGMGVGSLPFTSAGVQFGITRTIR